MHGSAPGKTKELSTFAGHASGRQLRCTSQCALRQDLLHYLVHDRRHRREYLARRAGTIVTSSSWACKRARASA
eukprot:3734944-Alexandrium_andersonii.AAC.1